VRGGIEDQYTGPVGLVLADGCCPCESEP
jgi:hypothetical protein